MTTKDKAPLGKFMGAQCLKNQKKKKKQVFNISGINLQCFAESIHAFCEEHCRVLDFTILASRQHGTIAARLVVPADESHYVESESIA